MRKLIVLSTVFSYFAVVCFASNPFDNFKDKIINVSAAQAQSNLDNLAKDLGPLLGGDAYRSGKNLGFPGFDISVRTPYAKVSDDDAVIKAAGIDNLPFPMIQAEIGLPFRIDVIGRFASYYNSTMTGFGLKYCLLKSWIPGVPYVSVQSVYNTLNVSSDANKLKANTLSSALVASWKFLVIEPYVGVSYDNTTVNPELTPSVSLNGSANTVRYDGGVNLVLFPLTYIQLGVSSSSGNTGYTAGLGLSF